MAKKPVLTAKEAAAMIPDGATIMCGGFLACGQARAIVKELVALGTKDLTLIANDMGRAVGPKGEEFFGIAELIHNHHANLAPHEIKILLAVLPAAILYFLYCFTAKCSGSFSSRRSKSKSTGLL